MPTIRNPALKTHTFHELGGGPGGGGGGGNGIFKHGLTTLKWVTHSCSGSTEVVHV